MTDTPAPARTGPHGTRDTDRLTMPPLSPPSPARRVLLPAMLALTTLVAACGDREAEAGSRPALPPGMTRQLPTNADARPPAVPFSPATPRVTVQPVASWPHDTLAYTQGLLVHEGRLLETTGIEGKSDLREVTLSTGRVVRRTPLPRAQFGEGIAVVGDRIYQLTWKSGRGYVYDARSLARVDSFTYRGEGWGLASDGPRLWMSDGSSVLREVEPAGFRTVRTVRVTEAGRPVRALNELEMVGGELWANIYQTDWIARIDPATGVVRGWIYLGALLTPRERNDVIRRGGTSNGIALDSANGRVLLTGKHWPRTFAVPLAQVAPVVQATPVTTPGTTP